jgi:hypothetical protein
MNGTKVATIAMRQREKKGEIGKEGLRGNIVFLYTLLLLCSMQATAYLLPLFASHEIIVWTTRKKTFLNHQSFVMGNTYSDVIVNGLTFMLNSKLIVKI